MTNHKWILLGDYEFLHKCERCGARIVMSSLGTFRGPKEVSLVELGIDPDCDVQTVREVNES